MRPFFKQLKSRGWERIDLTVDDQLQQIDSLRKEIVTEFNTVKSRLTAESNAKTGQHGFTADGDEGSGIVREARSHLMLNQTLPASHPLAILSPPFYGTSEAHAGSERLRNNATRLSTTLDRLTLATFEQLEIDLGLPFGELAGTIAMGERLLRIQWYPHLRNGRAKRIEIRTGNRPVEVVGAEIHTGSGQFSDVVRVSPHIDTGHWTWQVHATDSGLRFLDESTSHGTEMTSGNWLYGNVCEFLTDDMPGLPSPVHWVDLTGEWQTKDRVSISYFVHTRPSVNTSKIADGVKLYRVLSRLGYSVEAELRQAETTLFGADLDYRLIHDCLLWEESHELPAGFGVGTSRYFRLAPDGASRRTERAERLMNLGQNSAES